MLERNINLIRNINRLKVINKKYLNNCLKFLKILMQYYKNVIIIFLYNIICDKC